MVQGIDTKHISGAITEGLSKSVIAKVFTNVGFFKGGFFGVVHYASQEAVNHFSSDLFKDDREIEETMHKTVKFAIQEFAAISMAILGCGALGMPISFHGAVWLVILTKAASYTLDYLDIHPIKELEDCVEEC